jgi:homoserine O-acetyltransferase/O-succinyltransferase
MRVTRIMAAVLSLVVLMLRAATAVAQQPGASEADFTLKDFTFASGEALPELRLHYRTLGGIRRDGQGLVRNAVLILHGTGASSEQFLRPEGLGVSHLRLVMGTSMGGMHTWLWGGLHPEFMDALMPLASLPTQISGRNRVWRRLISDAIRSDPGWQGGEYTTQPAGLRTALGMLFLVVSNPVQRQAQMPTLAASDSFYDAAMTAALKTADANDLLYQVEASRDYDAG